MGFLKSLLVVVLMLAMLAFGILFSIENDMAVQLNILVMKLPAQSLSVWVMAAFALGAFFGMLVASLSSLRARTQKHMTERKLDRTQKELETLRAPALKG